MKTLKKFINESENYDLKNIKTRFKGCKTYGDVLMKYVNETNKDDVKYRLIENVKGANNYNKKYPISKKAEYLEIENDKFFKSEKDWKYIDILWDKPIKIKIKYSKKQVSTRYSLYDLCIYYNDELIATWICSTDIF